MLQKLPDFKYMKTQSYFFRFSFCSALFFSLVYIDIHQGKNKVVPNEKWKKQLWVFIYIKHSKFCSISLGQFIKHKLQIEQDFFFNFSTYFWQFLMISKLRMHAEEGTEIVKTWRFIKQKFFFEKLKEELIHFGYPNPSLKYRTTQKTRRRGARWLLVPGGEIQSREHNDLLNLILETTAKEAASHQKCTSSTHIFQRRVERGLYFSGR